MTEQRTRALPRPSMTLVAGLMVFVVVLGVLFWQVRNGRDPALAGKQLTAQAAPPAPRRVLVRRVVRKVIDDKVIVIHPAPTPVAAPVATSAPTYSSSGSSAPVVVQSAPRVTYAAPTYTPAPAPAPAPAPVVTRTS